MSVGAAPLDTGPGRGHHGPVATADRTPRSGVPGAGGPPHATVHDEVSLADGTRVVVRSVEPEDADELAAKYHQLSATSAYRRFFTNPPELPAQQVRYFTVVDHHDHEAVGAVTAEDGDGIGVARYIRDKDDPERAELAIVILDAWQGRGVGGHLMRTLIGRARAEGIRTLHAEYLSENPALPALLRRCGRVRTHPEGTVSSATLDLDRSEPADDRTGV